MKIRQKPVEDLGFQIAPMCDVLLVLLIFFVAITSVSSLRSDREITLPVSPNATKKVAARAEALINVKWIPEKASGAVVVEGKIYTELPQITDLLAPRLKTDPTYRVIIRADKKAPAELVENVMSAAAAAGISDITFSVLNHE